MFLQSVNRAACIILFAAGILIVREVQRRQRESKWPKLVGPSMLETVMAFQSSDAPFFFVKLMEKHGPVFRIRFPFVYPAMVIADWKVFKEGDSKLEIEAFEKGTLYSFMRELFGGYLTMFSKPTYDPHAGWAGTRKCVAGLFSQAHLDKESHVIVSKLAELDSLFHENASNATRVNLADAMLRFTVDILFASLFKTEAGALSDTKGDSLGCRVLKCISVSVKEMLTKRAGPAIIRLIRYCQVWDYQEMRNAELCQRELQAMARKLIDDFRAAGPNEHNKDSLLHAIVNGPYKSDEERMADIILFIFAGHDTTAYMLAWILIELYKSPSSLERLRQELDASNPSRGPCKPDMLRSFKYLEAVVNEGMRLWPSVPVGGWRRNHLGRDVEVNGYVIPKNAEFVFPALAAQRGPDVPGGDPNLYMPERWLANEEDYRTLKSMMGLFSLGKRRCVGEPLAMSEIRATIAYIAQRFTLTLDEEVVCDCFVTLKPLNAFALVELRQ